MKILIACEESQIVTKAFRAKGHEAYSCDILPASGGHPEWHIEGDAITEAYSGKYDMMIAHPPCTYMSKAGARWMYPKAGVLSQERLKLAMEAKEFFLKLLNAPIERIAIENPTPLKIIGLPPPLPSHSAVSVRPPIFQAHSFMAQESPITSTHKHSHHLHSISPEQHRREEKRAILQSRNRKKRNGEQ